MRCLSLPISSTLVVLTAVLLQTQTSHIHAFVVGGGRSGNNALPMFGTRTVTASSSNTDTIAIALQAASDDEDSWDFDEDYSSEDSNNDNKPRKLNPDGTPQLGINIGKQLEPLTPEQAQELRDEATETINAVFDDRLSDIASIKENVAKDFEASKKAMQFASNLRAKEQQEKLMNKIDNISNAFLDQNEELRSGTKLAASADRNMSGVGLEVGSWGTVGNNNVLTTAAGGASLGDESGLLGSVSQANIDGSTTSTQSEFEVDTQVKGADAEKIMIICDDKQDKNLKTVLSRFEELLGENFPTSTITIDNYSPTAMIPMGGNNAKCAIIVSTSLSNGQSSAETILGRILKRTIAPGGGGVAKPPSHFVILSPLGTERIEIFPYSVQNMMGGNKLKKAREVEEVIMATVKGRVVVATDNSMNNKIPALDYTILKWGEIVDDSKLGTKNPLTLSPGDSLDGKVGIEAAAKTLLQAVALQPNARNATLSVAGGMDEEENDVKEVWEDWFRRLDGPELWRSQNLVVMDIASEDEMAKSFERLAGYMSGWSDLFETNGIKGLTTPVYASSSRETTLSDSIRRRYSVRLEFKQTRTGSAYKSKSEERRLEQQRPESPSSSSSPPAPRSNRQKREGGVEVLVEEVVSTKKGQLELRVRARRCNMNDNTVVKEISEDTILSNLAKAVKVWQEQ